MKAAAIAVAFITAAFTGLYLGKYAPETPYPIILIIGLVIAYGAFRMMYWRTDD